MDKRLIKPLEGWMAIPEIVTVLSLSRARVHQLIEEDKFDVDDMRVVGDKRMVLIKNAAVYGQLRNQEERSARIAAERAEEEQRCLTRAIIRESKIGEKVTAAKIHANNLRLEAAEIPEPTALDFEEASV